MFRLQFPKSSIDKVGVVRDQCPSTKRKGGVGIETDQFYQNTLFYSFITEGRED